MDEKQKLTVGSPFGGCGGTDLGLEATGGFKTTWTCEYDEESIRDFPPFGFPAAVFARHFPSVPNYGDITKLGFGRIPKSDVLTYSFPCQDISIAGKGKGIDGSRSGLWGYIHPFIAAARPRWIIIENSPELINRGLGRVLADLGREGYTPLRPLLLEAGYCGAIQRRMRLFLIAHSDESGRQHGNADRERGQVLHHLGGTECEENQQERHEWQRGAGKNTSFPPANDGKERIHGKRQEEIRQFPGLSWCEGIGSLEDLCRRPDIPQPLLRRNLHGFSRRLYQYRIAALGNAVVPQVAQVVGEMILEMEGRKIEGD